MNKEDKEKIMQIYERAMLNRNINENEAVEFIESLEKEILVQYLSPAQFQTLFNNNRPLTFDLEFQNILLDLLAKLKDDLRNVNKTLDQQMEESEKLKLTNYNNFFPRV